MTVAQDRVDLFVRFVARREGDLIKSPDTMMVALALSLAVWLGGTLALMTKGTLALVVGKKVMAWN